MLDIPYVKTRANLLESFNHIGVVLVDQDGARLFHYFLSEHVEQEGIAGEEVRQSKQGSGSISTGRRSSAGDQARYANELIDHNLR